MQATLERQQAGAHSAIPSHRGLRARTRGAVLLGLVGFVLLQAGMGTLVECRPELRDPNFEIKYRQLVKLLSQHPQPPATVVFFGSSMSANGMKAGVVEEPAAAALGRPVASYNLATNGAGPVTHLVHLQRLLRRGIRPDLVVLEASPLGFEAGQNALDIQRLPAHILEYADLDTIERHASQPDLREEWWKSQLVPTYGHRLMLLNQSVRILVPNCDQIELWTDVDEHGWRPRPVPAPEQHQYALSQIDLQFRGRLAAYRADEAPLQALREVTDLLAQERIATVVVLMPAGPLMRSFAPPEGMAPVLAELDALSKKPGFHVVNAHEWYDESMFVDSYHLHQDGAQVFTERLAREAIAPALQAR
jgi:hypothetical protein